MAYAQDPNCQDRDESQVVRDKTLGMSRDRYVESKTTSMPVVIGSHSTIFLELLFQTDKSPVQRDCKRSVWYYRD